ncbi:hypothetical protein JTE90_009572 [Oedothorax gibbosus]|uniref:Uncharacterized protein n=1 Tax=Oedothorax gibbosus TaxID=931172 RepID=A0AAV6VKY1_9ARAC|nr:hypothetical protein JTE90_009572 [Oedothorax gibbosus]
MESIYLQLVVAFCICVIGEGVPNSTEKVRSGRVRDPNVLNLLQQIQGHLSSLELESQRHTSSLVEVLRSTTRLEAQRQEFIGVLDRSETHLSQRMEDVKGDARKGHLSFLELESQRHTFILVDVLRATTRQEFIGVLDRSETHLSQRMEDVKGDAR